MDEEKAAHRFRERVLDAGRCICATRSASIGMASDIPELVATNTCMGRGDGAVRSVSAILGIISQEQLVALFQTRREAWRKDRASTNCRRGRRHRNPQRFRTALVIGRLAEKLISVTKRPTLLRDPVALIAKEMRGEDAYENRHQ